MVAPLSARSKPGPKFRKNTRKVAPTGFPEQVQHCGVAIGPEALFENNVM